jgi:eukaryotic-like serine/threonine-protein kinase
MSLRNYLTSKTFFIQLLLALLFTAVIIFLLLKWINFATNHGEEIVVPNLKKLSVEAVEEKLEELDLDYELVDTTDYDPNFPKYSVVKQEPTAGSKVKEGRKIYIKINAATYKSIKFPNFVQQTLREVIPSLRALGLQEGEITYVHNIGKDMVLELIQNGKVLQPGDKILRNSKIDLVVGDGIEVIESEEIDSTAVDSTKNE